MSPLARAITVHIGWLYAPYPMDLPPAWSQACACGRLFSVPQAYTCHKRSCQKTKKRLSCALEKAKEVWQAKKRRKTEERTKSEAVYSECHLNESSNAAELLLNDAPLPGVHPQVGFLTHAALSLMEGFCICQSAETPAMGYEDQDQSLAERRSRREHHQLPKRYRDIVPEPPAALPPSSQVVAERAQVERDASRPSQQPPTHLSRVRKVFQSGRNRFGLFRKYYAPRFPDHDPAENIRPSDLMDSSPDISSAVPVNNYDPYPNQSSFLLGEWYWNDGEKKSQSSFQNLLKIVGHPDFRPEDVAGKNWRIIDAHLSGERSEGPNDEDGWEDEQGGGDWIKTPIKINIPFHKRTLHPGQQVFDAGILHHRRLMSVIREKITRPSTHPHLHFEPYEFFWQPHDVAKPVRVHGELYTSEAFFEAHRELQDSPGEPGCDLPRVVLGLMFASDGTQLTAFSNAKLWPVYLVIGNESKDRRSKPSCQAFEHIAYLETVRESQAVCYETLIPVE
jgi:hypothetical protein